MSELLANGSFETAGNTQYDAASWTRSNTTYAFRAAGFGEDGGACFSCTYGPIFGGGTADGRGVQSVTSPASVLLAVDGRVKRTNGNTGCEIVDATTGTVLASVAAGAATGDWQSLTGLVVTPGALLSLEIRNIADGAAVSSTWLFDALSVETVNMARHLHTAVTALYTRLGTINGSAGGYYTTLTNRIYARLLDPQVAGGTGTLPYACMVLRNKVEYSPVDGTFIRAMVPITVYGFINEAIALDSTASAVDALKFVEDITRAVMPSGATPWNLGSTQIEDVQIDPQPIEVGVGDGYEYAVVPVEIQVFIRFGRSDLGPNA